MARYLSYILFLCAAAFGARAQNFDINAVEVEVNMNPARYRTLLDRFERADTT